MHYCTPEEVGISSSDLLCFYKGLDDYRLSTHSVIFARGDAIFSECYYEPFHKDFLHRMYSVSKSFVSVAVGFCVQDGLLSLDDPVVKFFPKELEIEGATPQTTTIRDLLMMESAQTGINWFKKHPENRADVYFTGKSSKLPGTLFDYDSSGSYMLSTIVERLTGMPFLTYLQKKVLNDIGFSRDAYCILAPGGYSFGDSGVMCSARDLLLFARFVLNGGTFNGKRYLNAEYLKEACTMRVCNTDYGFRGYDQHGYGYQFWGAPHGGFAMLGMGNQIALCDPVHDVVFVINSDNQGNSLGYQQIYDLLYHYVLDRISNASLPEDPEAHRALEDYLASRRLFALDGDTSSPFSEKISKKTFYPEENPMEIRWFSLEFHKDGGIFHYENAQGKKEMPFGFGHNVLAPFPQTGYSDLVANRPAPGNTYRAACSADWPEDQKLRIRVQIIDKYFGNLAIVFGFADEHRVTVRMSKTAEDFLAEYQGVMIATDEKE